MRFRNTPMRLRSQGLRERLHTKPRKQAIIGSTTALRTTRKTCWRNLATLGRRMAVPAFQRRGVPAFQRTTGIRREARLLALRNAIPESLSCDLTKSWQGASVALRAVHRHRRAPPRPGPVVLPSWAVAGRGVRTSLPSRRDTVSAPPLPPRALAAGCGASIAPATAHAAGRSPRPASSSSTPPSSSSLARLALVGDAAPSRVRRRRRRRPLPRKSTRRRHA